MVSKGLSAAGRRGLLISTGPFSMFHSSSLVRLLRSPLCREERFDPGLLLKAGFGKARSSVTEGDSEPDEVDDESFNADIVRPGNRLDGGAAVGTLDALETILAESD